MRYFFTEIKSTIYKIIFTFISFDKLIYFKIII